MFRILPILIVLLSIQASAQAPKPDEPRIEPQPEVVTFKSNASFVRLDVQVVQDNRVVTDLAKDDFVISDEGQPQPVSYFGREAEPLNLLILLDISGSMTHYIEQIADRAQEALRYLRPGDKVGVMVFARTTHIRQTFTTDFAQVAAEIRSAVHDETVGSGTAINSAALDAAAYMKTLDSADGPMARTGRRSILILTDNKSLNYQIPDDQVTRELEMSNTVMNAIVVGKGFRPAPPRTDRPTNPDFTPADVFILSDLTGGEAVTSDRADAAFQQMIERIRTRYTLQYRMPQAGASGYRRVRVTLAESARRRYPHAEIRSRRGYVAG